MQATLTSEGGNIYDTPMDTAWSRLDNVNVSYQILINKIGHVFKIQNGYASDIKAGLPYLTQSQVEDMAPWKYNGKLTQYLVPSGSRGAGCE